MNSPEFNRPLYLHVLILFLLFTPPDTAMASRSMQSCAGCHADRQQGFAPAHAAFAQDCTQCHLGDPGRVEKADAHRNLIAFPGDMRSLAPVCGDCHADKVDGVLRSLMHTGAGMVATTRRVFGEKVDRPGHNNLTHLTHTPADSLLRKQCASCHLAQEKELHRLDTTRDRGGGCLACHVNAQPSKAHAALTAQVSDARCFGCHSRSGRISLNYTGIAETDNADTAAGKLEDGRIVVI